MNDSEKSVYEYLIGRGFSTIVYEPDGNVPPDFLVDGRIAIEVRRLNQNEETAPGHRSLEEVSKPLNALVKNALAAIGPPVDGSSWFVFYSFSRPLPPWIQLKKLLGIALREARDRPSLRGGEIQVANNFRLSFAPASKAHRTFFILGGWCDHNSAGFVVSEMARNLQICISEKAGKVSKVKSRYSEWWLILEDRIGYGDLDKSDLDQLSLILRIDERWNKIIVVNPLKPSMGFEL